MLGSDAHPTNAEVWHQSNEVEYLLLENTCFLQLSDTYVHLVVMSQSDVQTSTLRVTCKTALMFKSHPFHTSKLNSADELCS